jgi:hypothetical protein
MPWNRDKWNQFVIDNKLIPPTDEAARKAAAEVEKLAEGYNEDINLDALGVQRVDEMLRKLAAETPGTRGYVGSDGTTSPNSLIILTDDYWSGTGTHDTSYTFATGEFDNYHDIIMVKSYAIGDDVKLIWSATIPPATTTLMDTAPCLGYYEYWIAQNWRFVTGGPVVWDLSECLAETLRIGVSYAATQVQNIHFELRGTLTVRMTTAAPGQHRVTIGTFKCRP